MALDTSTFPKVGDTVYTLGHSLPSEEQVAVSHTVTKTTPTGFTTSDGRRWLFPRYGGLSDNPHFYQWGGSRSACYQRADGLKVVTLAEYQEAHHAALEGRLKAADDIRRAKFEELGAAEFIRSLIKDGSPMTTELRKLRELMSDDEAFITELVQALSAQASFRRYVKNAVANLSRLVEEF